jgi:hypothetical protein
MLKQLVDPIAKFAQCGVNASLDGPLGDLDNGLPRVWLAAPSQQSPNASFDVSHPLHPYAHDLCLAKADRLLDALADRRRRVAARFLSNIGHGRSPMALGLRRLERFVRPSDRFWK